MEGMVKMESRSQAQRDAENEILEMVRRYSRLYHASKEYKYGDKISYAARMYDE